MLRHRWKILTGIAVAFVVFICIEVATIGNGPKKEVEAYKKSLIAQGEKLEISELLPPPVSPEQNGADLVNQALVMLTSEEEYPPNLIPLMPLVAAGKEMVYSKQPDVRDSNFTNTWANAMTVVRRERPITELLRKAVAYPAIDLHLGGGAWEFMHQKPISGGSDRLATEAICALHQGDVASASTNICVILALVNCLGNQRSLVYEEQRFIMILAAANTTWELLQSGNSSDTDLAILQGSWERVEVIPVMENEILMQRAIDESEAVKLQTSSEYFDMQTSGAMLSDDFPRAPRSRLKRFADNARFVCCKFIYRGSRIYSDEMQMLRHYQIVLETIRTVETNQCFYPAFSEMTDQLWALGTNQPDDWLAKLDTFGLHDLVSASDLRTTVRDAMGLEAVRRIEIAAIALKRYQLKHGSYPASLSDLTPKFIPSVPRDPIDGKSLRYRLMPNGSFLLYSIGDNGRDDGGDGSFGRKSSDYPPSIWFEPDLLDWVWPQPATAAEIQYFYAHRSKP
jgi:hypothetical protein